MKDTVREDTLRKLINDGSKCKRANNLIREYDICDLHKGICMKNKSECWLEFCEQWIQYETRLSGDLTSKRVVKPLFISREPRAMSVVKVTKDGISERTEMTK